MNCPTCGVAAVIEGKTVKVTGDTTAEEQTIVKNELRWNCRNPRCSQFGKEIGVSEHQIYP